MKLSYANVMSTIAMFAAVTTGTGYAAQQLGRDSVRSLNIKNGQVTLADLHPSGEEEAGSDNQRRNGPNRNGPEELD